LIYFFSPPGPMRDSQQAYGYFAQFPNSWIP
jgi:hypothetical protein